MKTDKLYRLLRKTILHCSKADAALAKILNDGLIKNGSHAFLSYEDFGTYNSMHTTMESFEEWIKDLLWKEDKYYENLDHTERASLIKTLLDYSYSLGDAFLTISRINKHRNKTVAQKNALELSAKMYDKFKLLRKIIIHPSSIYLDPNDFDSIYDYKCGPYLFLTNVKNGGLNLFLQKKNLKLLLGYPRGDSPFKRTYFYLIDDYLEVKDEKYFDDVYEVDLKYKLLFSVQGEMKLLYLSFRNDNVFSSFYKMINLMFILIYSWATLIAKENKL